MSAPSASTAQPAAGLATVSFASWLLQEAVLPRESVLAAVGRQVVYGGSLDTALLENDVLGVEDLWALLSRAVRLPIPPVSLLGKKEWPALPFPLAASRACRAIPAGERDDGVLQLLCGEPVELAALRRLATELGRTFELFVAPEVHVEGLRSVLYGRPMPARHAKLWARLVGRAGLRIRTKAASPGRQEFASPARAEEASEAATEDASTLGVATPLLAVMALEDVTHLPSSSSANDEEDAFFSPRPASEADEPPRTTPPELLPEAAAPQAETREATPQPDEPLLPSQAVPASIAASTDPGSFPAPMQGPTEEAPLGAPDEAVPASRAGSGAGDAFSLLPSTHAALASPDEAPTSVNGEPRRTLPFPLPLAPPPAPEPPPVAEPAYALTLDFDAEPAPEDEPSAGDEARASALAWDTFSATEALCRRARDPADPGRTLALRALRRRLNMPPAPTLRRELVTLLEQGSDAAALGALADLTEMRDREAVPAIIPLLEAPDRKLAGAARSALSLLTLQDFGTRPRKWESWWEAHRHEPPTTWLFEGLSHKEAPLRLAAAEELRQLTGAYFGYHFDLPKRDREEAKERWQRWWQAMTEHEKDEAGG